MGTNIPPVDINSVLQGQIASKQRSKEVDKEANDRERGRQQQIQAELMHSSQVEDPNAPEPVRPLRDEERRRSRNGARHDREQSGPEQQPPSPDDQYIPSEEAREQGLAGADTDQADAGAPKPPVPPQGPEHIIDLEA